MHAAALDPSNKSRQWRRAGDSDVFHSKWVERAPSFGIRVRGDRMRLPLPSVTDTQGPQLLIGLADVPEQREIEGQGTRLYT